MKRFFFFALLLACALPCAAAPRGGKAKSKAAADPGAKPMVHWDCDKPFAREPGLTVEKSPSGAALGGFSDESVRMTGLLPNAVSKNQRLPDAWTFQCFVRDIHPLTNRVALVARFEDGPRGEPPAVAWQLWVERSGALCLGVEDAKGVRSVARHAGAPWRPGVWHHVAIVRELGGKDADGAREDRYRVWVVPLAVPAAAAAKPGPLIDHRLVTKAGPFHMSALAVGGAPAGKHPETAPGGALGGTVDDVSLWARAFSDDELAACRAAFLAGGGAAAAAEKKADEGTRETLLHWSFSGDGKTPQATDLSGRGCHGRSAERVRGGVQGRGSGKAFEGFSTEGSLVSSMVLPQHAFRGEWTLLVWVRNPRLSSKQACVLASSDPEPRRGTVAWRFWFDSKGAPHVGAQDGSSHRFTGAGKPVRFEPGKWHLVALTHRRGPGPLGGERDFFQAFVVPDGARGPAPEPALDWSCGGGKLANATMLQIGAGAAGRGKNAEIAPGGWFGGQIGEAMLLGGAALDGAAVAEFARKKSLGD